MKTTEPLHVCIMGHSGIGKTPVSTLFRVPGWDPFRVRVPRDAKDKAMSKETYSTLLSTGRFEPMGWDRGELLYPNPHAGEDASDGAVIRKKLEDGADGLCVCRNWSFFKVRDARQCLYHGDFDPQSSMRIEIFAPVLLTMVRNWQRLTSAFRLDPKNLLVIILNPTSQSFRDMSTPSPSLCMAAALAVTERARVRGDPVDLADALRRVEHLQSELAAWSGFLKDETINTVECLEWPHFEFRYHSDHGAELERARNTLFQAIAKQSKWTAQERNMWTGRMQSVCMV